MKPTLLDWKTTPEEIKDLYVNEMWSERKLAGHFRVNPITIKKYLEKHGIPIRTERLMLLDKITNPKEIHKLYWEENLSLTEIANKFKVTSKEPVIHYMRRHEIPVRSQEEGLINYVEKTSFIRNIDSETIKSIEKLHWEDQKNQREIIKDLNLDITPSQFCNVLNAHNIPHRNAQEARQLMNDLGQDRKHTLNQNFFSTWSPEMFYVLGWIYSDGCIDNEDRVRIGTKDKYILENIKKMMGSSHQLTVNKRTELYQLELISKKMYRDLSNFGLHPRKSLTITFPSVQNKYLRHFVRGEFEGDGCVWIERYNGEKAPNIFIEFYSGSKRFLEGLNQAISSNTNITLKNLYHKKSERGQCNVLKYSGCNSYELFNFMYEDVPEYMILKRKYERFNNFFLPLKKKGLSLIKTMESLNNGNGKIYLKEITDSYNKRADQTDQISYVVASYIFKVLGYTNKGKSRRGIYFKT